MSSDYITKDYLDGAIKAAVGEMAELFRDGLQMIAERFDEVDKRFKQVDERFEQIDKRFAKVDRRFDRIEERLDRMEDKLDRTTAVSDLHAVDIRQLKRKASLA